MNANVKGAYLSDLEALRSRAREQIMKGAVTPSYPDLNPATLLQRSHAEYDEETSLRRMLEADLVAERIAIESYREMINFIGLPKD